MKNRIRNSIFIIAIGVAFAAPAYSDEVTDWNQILLEALPRAGFTGINATRPSAIVASAVYDAVNGIEELYTPIHVVPAAGRNASLRGAAVQAAYATLVQLFPDQQATFAAKRLESLTAIAGDPHETERSIASGIAWGQHVAEGILEWRSHDGFVPALAPFLGGTAVGQWRPTPPAFLPGAVPQFSYMTPWIIRSPSQFQPPGPPHLRSAEYASAVNEVKLLGSISSVSRTTDQTLAAQFWQSSSSPNLFWSHVAISLASQRRNTLLDNARLLGLVHLAIADAGIAAWNAKYKFVFWRPITAIQLADTDGNPGTIADPNWTPLLVTPPYPEYSSGLLFVSTAAVTVLADYFGSHTSFTVDSDGMPGVTRFFPDFPAVLDELVEARIWGGIHFRFADVDSRRFGTALANYILRHSFRRAHGRRAGQAID